MRLKKSAYMDEISNSSLCNFPPFPPFIQIAFPFNSPSVDFFHRSHSSMTPREGRGGGSGIFQPQVFHHGSDEPLRHLSMAVVPPPPYPSPRTSTSSSVSPPPSYLSS